jgi:hypothetical protein
MAEDWAQATAKKVEGRLAEEAERAATQRKRFEEGVQRLRKQLLDLVAAVNQHIEHEQSRIHTIVLDNGLILVAAYKRIVTTEEAGVRDNVPACVGWVRVERESRKASAPVEPEEIFITAAGTQTAFYRRSLRDQRLVQFVDADFRQLVEYFAS